MKDVLLHAVQVNYLACLPVTNGKQTEKEAINKGKTQHKNNKSTMHFYNKNPEDKTKRIVKLGEIIFNSPQITSNCQKKN